MNQQTNTFPLFMEFQINPEQADDEDVPGHILIDIYDIINIKTNEEYATEDDQDFSVITSFDNDSNDEHQVLGSVQDIQYRIGVVLDLINNNKFSEAMRALQLNYKPSV